MIERLSSIRTTYFKVAFPLLWIGGFGLGTFALWGGCFNESNPPPPWEMKLMFLVGRVTGSSFIIWLGRRLKYVTLFQDHLLVEDYRKEIDIPLSSINHMSETRLWNPKQIILQIHPECEFGEKIVFIRRFQFYNPFGEHPTIKLLRDLIEGQNAT